MSMETSMKENGKMIWLMEMVYILILEERNTKDNGKMTYKMDMERKNGPMEQNMKFLYYILI